MAFKTINLEEWKALGLPTEITTVQFLNKKKVKTPKGKKIKKDKIINK